MNEGFSFAVGDEVVLPGYELTAAIDRSLEELKAAATVIVVPHVVLAAPQQLHRCSHRLRNPRRFAHEIVIGTSAESSSGANHANGDIRFGNPQQASHLGASRRWKLTAAPNLDFPVLVICR